MVCKTPGVRKEYGGAKPVTEGAAPIMLRPVPYNTIRTKGGLGEVNTERAKGGSAADR